MAERLTKHVWTSPKCGMTLVDNYWMNVESPVDYEFVIVRNPWARLYSFYVNKIIYKTLPQHYYKDVEHICDYVEKYNNPRGLLTDFKNFEIFGDHDQHIPIGRLLFKTWTAYFEDEETTRSINELSFREFIHSIRDAVEEYNYRALERHLTPQTYFIDGHEFNKVVKLEKYREDIKEVCEALGIEYESVANTEGGKRNTNHKTGPYEENVSDKPATWFREKCIVPSNYQCFYDEELKKLVGDLYFYDVEKFEYEF